MKDDHFSDKAAKSLADSCRRYQLRLCQAINNRLSGISPGKMKTALIIFCLASSCLSLYIAFSYDQPSFIPMPIEIPSHIHEMGTKTIENSPMVSAETYHQIQTFKKLMDSLNQPIEKSLQDSLLLLEKIYQLK